MSTLSKGTRGAANAAKPNVQQRVLDALSDMKFTRRELSNITGIEIATLCGALKALESIGLVSANETTICSTTGREVLLYTTKGIE